MDERICPPDPGPGGREVEPPRDAGWVLLNGRRHPLPDRCNVVQLLQRCAAADAGKPPHETPARRHAAVRQPGSGRVHIDVQPRID